MTRSGAEQQPRAAGDSMPDPDLPPGRRDILLEGEWEYRNADVGNPQEISEPTISRTDVPSQRFASSVGLCTDRCGPEFVIGRRSHKGDAVAWL